MNFDGDPLLHPTLGLDAPTFVRRDDLLATQGLLTILRNLLEEPGSISKSAMRKLAGSTGRSTLPVHNFGPHETNLSEDDIKAKLVGILEDLTEKNAKVIGTGGLF